MIRNEYRVGIGYDVHILVENCKLIIGGVDIPHDKGLLGHSDADVLTHAIMDAILGALGLGDIGQHFPDSDEKYKGADSIMLLGKVIELCEEKGYKPENLDSVIVAQMPKISPYRETMRARLADAMKINVDKINIKATTTEGLGFEGRGEGISAKAVVLLKRK